MTQVAGSRRGGASIARRVFDLLASLIRLVVRVAAALLVGHVVLAVGAANPVNPITVFFREAALRLTFGVSEDPASVPVGLGTFLPAEPRLAVVVVFGVAAVLWLVAGGIVARVVRALGPGG